MTIDKSEDINRMDEQNKWKVLKNNVWTIEYIKEPSEEMCLYCVKKAWNTLKFIENPSKVVVDSALNNNGWAIQYIKNPTIEQQKLAVENNPDAVKFIKDPVEEIQAIAVGKNYNILKYIESPTLNVKIIAIKQNAEAIKYFNFSDNELLLFIKTNLMVLKFIDKFDENKIKEIIKDKITSDTVEEDYIKQFIEIKTLNIDKDRFIYTYGCKNAKKYYVDYSLDN